MQNLQDSKGQASSSELSSCPRYYQTTDNECDTRYQDTSKHPRSETPDSTAARTRRWRRESTPLSPTLLPISREQNESRGIQSFIYEQEEPRVFFLAETEARTSENISETRMHRESVPSPPPPSPQPPTTRSQSLSVRWSVPDENREEIEEEKLEEEDGESLEEALYRAYASETIAEMESRARLFRTLGEVFERDVIMGERVLDLYAERILSLWEPNFTISPQNPTSNHQFTTLKSYVKYILARARYPPDADDPVNVQLIQQQEVLSEWAWTNWASLKLMLALIYIERLRKMEPLFKGESGCSHRVFFAAFVVASKYVDISFARPRTQLQLSNDFKQNEEYYPEQEYESQTVPESEKKKEDELSELMGDSNKGNFNCGLIHEDEEQIRQSHVITLEEDNIEELLRNSRKVRHEDDYSDQDDIENREELLQNSVRVIHEDEELEEIMRNSYVLDDISVSNDNSAIYTNFPASSIPSNFNDSAQADSDYTNASDSDTSEYSSSSVDTILFMPNYHNSYYWSEMTNFVFPPDEITRMERDLLHMIDFHLRVASKDIIDCWRRCCLDERQIVPDKKYASPLVYRYREDELVINYDNEAPNFYVGGELGEGDATVPRWE
ncbi:hypothetical protein G9A89_017327 [Geosiphon pyriformis]|nr:hypothetical protein G9A89_017327 [Geosiphon pyriformis]